MLKVYVNYPNSRISIHRDDTCAQIRSHRKANQRQCLITPDTITKELRNFKETYQFASVPEFNDMWVSIDFGDYEFEKALIKYLSRILGKRYKPLLNAQVEEHC